MRAIPKRTRQHRSPMIKFRLLLVGSDVVDTDRLAQNSTGSAHDAVGKNSL